MLPLFLLKLLDEGLEIQVHLTWSLVLQALGGEESSTQWFQRDGGGGGGWGGSNYMYNYEHTTHGEPWERAI